MPVQPRRRLSVRPGDAAQDTGELVVEATEAGDRQPEPAGASPTLGLPANLALPQGRS